MVETETVSRVLVSPNNESLIRVNLAGNSLIGIERPTCSTCPSRSLKTGKCTAGGPVQPKKALDNEACDKHPFSGDFTSLQRITRRAEIRGVTPLGVVAELNQFGSASSEQIQWLERAEAGQQQPPVELVAQGHYEPGPDLKEAVARGYGSDAMGVLPSITWPERY